MITLWLGILFQLMVFIFVLGVGISCCGNSLAWLLGGSGVGTRAIGNTCNGGGIGGGSIDASARVAFPARNGGGGGGGWNKLLWFRSTEGAGGGGGGGRGGTGAGELFTDNDAFRDVPHVWSVPRQWQQRFAWNIEIESNVYRLKREILTRFIYLKARRTQQFGSVFSILQQSRSVDQCFRRVPRQIAGGVFRIEPQQMLKDAQKWYLLGGVCDLR